MSRREREEIQGRGWDEEYLHLHALRTVLYTVRFQRSTEAIGYQTPMVQISMNSCRNPGRILTRDVTNIYRCKSWGLRAVEPRTAM